MRVFLVVCPVFLVAGITKVQAQDERCEIPTINKPACVSNFAGLASQATDPNVDVILLCPGTIDLDVTSLRDIIFVESDRSFICDNTVSDDECIINGAGNQAGFVGNGENVNKVSFCTIIFRNFDDFVPPISSFEQVFISGCTFDNYDVAIAVIDQLEIQDSKFTGGSTAVELEGGSLTASNCKFEKHSLHAITMRSATGNLVDCDFIDNTLDKANSFSIVIGVGAVIALGGAAIIMLGESELTLEGCLFENNEAFVQGGAIHMAGNGSFRMTGENKLILQGDENAFINNKAKKGAHISVVGGSNNEISGCASTTFESPNQETGVFGKDSGC